MESKNEYRYKIELSQSLTSGIIALHGSVKYDQQEDAHDSIWNLLDNLKETEDELKHMGYKVAKDIEVKTKPIKEEPNKKPQ